MWNYSPLWPPAGSQPFPPPYLAPPRGDGAPSDLLDYQSGGNPFYPPRTPAATNYYSADPYLDGQWAPVLSPVPTVPGADQLRSDGYVPPYSYPHDLDDYGRETPEMVRAYLDFHRKEPAVRSAIDGKAAAVAALDLIVKPRSKNRPNDIAAAAFVKEQLDGFGADKLILNMLRPAFVLGWSINEKTLCGVSTPAGVKWGLKHCKNKDTNNLALRMDAYRNVIGIVNRVRGIHTHDPGKVILFTHADMFDNAFGQSDLRAAYRSANLINDAYQLWHIAIKVYGGPFLHGTVSDDNRRKQMETALKAARAAGFLVSPKGDDVEILNLATATSFDAFEKKVRIHREEIYLAVRHAYMPFMQSSSGGSDQRGDTGVNKHAASDPVEFLLAKAVGRCLTYQLAADLTEPNFPPGTGTPIVLLGGVNWAETKDQLDVIVTLKEKLGVDVSAEYVYEIVQMPPPKGPQDTPAGPRPPGQAAPAVPGAPAIPAMQDGAPAPTPAPAPSVETPPNPTPDAPSTFTREQAPEFARYFAGTQHGHYPGNMHEKFGLAVPEFADASGLKLKQVRGRDGSAGWVWAAPRLETLPTPAATFSAKPPAKTFADLADELIAEFQGSAA